VELLKERNIDTPFAGVKLGVEDLMVGIPPDLLALQEDAKAFKAWRPECPS
jgi:hypothetical protein